MKFKLAPLASDVTGRSGGIVMHHNKGNLSARRFKNPRNTVTTARTETRSLFATLQALYAGMSPQTALLWQRYGPPPPATPRSAHLSLNIAPLNHQPTFSAWVGSPWPSPPVAPILVSLIGILGGLRFTIDYPTQPEGWTYEGLLVGVFEDSDPRIPLDPTAYAWDERTTGGQPPAFNFTPLTSGQLYQAFLVISAYSPEGIRHYSPATRTEGTPL